MAARRFELILELHPGPVFYCLNYLPPIKGVGGSVGKIGEGGSLHGSSYEELRKLGDGRHFVEIDESIRASRGRIVEQCSDDEQQVATVRSALFMLRTGTFSLSHALCSVVLAFNDRTATLILNLLDGPSRAWLATYAKDIPPSPAERRVREFSVLDSNGATQVPDENLAAIHRYFSA
jgi:hypothetical protein